MKVKAYWRYQNTNFVLTCSVDSLHSSSHVLSQAVCCDYLLVLLQVVELSVNQLYSDNFDSFCSLAEVVVLRQNHALDFPSSHGLYRYRNHPDFSMTKLDLQGHLHWKHLCLDFAFKSDYYLGG